MKTKEELIALKEEVEALKKKLIGKLEAYDNGSVTVNGETYTKSQVAQVKLHVTI